MDPRKDASIANRFIRTLGAGKNGLVELSVPWSSIYNIVHDSRQAYVDSRVETRAAIAQSLPAEVQATKIAEVAPRGESEAGVDFEDAVESGNEVKSEEEKQAIKTAELFSGMDSELEILKLCRNRHDHPNLVKPIEAGKGWYNILPIGSRTLRELIQACDDGNNAPPKALAYHLAAELGKSLLYLHFGYVNGKGCLQDWQHITHNDLHDGNIMFYEPSAQSQGKVGNYPTLFILDFGHAEVFNFSKSLPAPNRKSLKKVFRLHRQEDVHQAMSGIGRFGSRFGDQKFQQAVEGLIQGGKKESTADACEALQQFVESMENGREKFYQDLPPEWLAFFVAPGLSRQEVDDILDAIDIFG